MSENFLHQYRNKMFYHQSLAKRIFAYLIASFVLLFLSGALFTIGAFIYFTKDLPSITDLKNINFTQSTIIYDKDKNPLYTVHGEENREVVELKDISPYIKLATIAIEDHDFYNHYGFYPKRIIAAALNNILNSGAKQGASTITQQFVKNNFLTSEKTYGRKIKELILAVLLERNYSKDNILKMYLNKIPYGNNTYGVQRAAQLYFGKKAKDLTLAESAILTSLPQAPSYYNPYGQHRYSAVKTEFDIDSLRKRNIQKEENLELNEISRGLIGHVNTLDENHKVYIRGRTDIVLKSLYDLKLITATEKQQAWEETQRIEFKPYRESIKAPHFVLYVKELLEKKYGKETVEAGGLKVYTTLDSHLQEVAEKAIADQIKINKENYGATNAALLSVEPETGKILAMVGSADYYDKEIDGNVNITLRARQPGSSFKPFVYALAFLKGYAPANVIYDTELRFEEGEPPKNFEGTFYGPVSMRTALGKSRNIPAIKTYFLVGEQKNIIPFVEKLGIESLDPNMDYGWPLAIGSGEIPMADMVQAYSIFANSGVKTPLAPILKITDSRGAILEQWQPNFQKEQVVDPQVAFLINNVLSDSSVNVGRRLNIDGHQVAAKTGTSTKKLKDNVILPSNGWVFGYTPKVVTGVWIGNSDGSAMKLSADGYNAAVPIWNSFMTEFLKNQPSADFPVPKEITQIAVTKSTGKLPGGSTPKDQIISEYFASFAVPTEIDNTWKTAAIDASSKELATAYCPRDMVKTKTFRIYHDLDPNNPRWEAGIQKWLAAAEGIIPPLPAKECHLHNSATGSAAPTIQIISPSSYGEIFGGINKVQVKIDAPHGVDRVEYYLDKKLQYKSKISPYHGKVRLTNVGQKKAEHTIGVKIIDTLGYSSFTEIPVNFQENSVNNKTETSPEDNFIEEPE